MKAQQMTIGRNFAVTMEHGDDFFLSLERFFKDYGLTQAYIPGFIAGFSTAEIVGTLNKQSDYDAPIWESTRLERVEVVGSGTLATNETGDFSPHIHVSVGEKFAGGRGFVGHLLQAKVAFLSEMFIVEILSPRLIRVKNEKLYNVPLLTIAEDE